MLRAGCQFDRRRHDELAPRIDVERRFSFHAKVLSLEVLHFANAQVTAKVNRGNRHASLKGSTPPITQTSSCPSSICACERSSCRHRKWECVCESDQDRGLIAASRPSTSLRRMVTDLSWERSEAEDRWSQTQSVNPPCPPQPARQPVGPASTSASSQRPPRSRNRTWCPVPSREEAGVTPMGCHFFQTQ